MFILFYFSILFFAFRDLERAEILSRHSNREELKLLPRRNQGLECAYIAMITEKNSSVFLSFQNISYRANFMSIYRRLLDITQGSNFLSNHSLFQKQN